MIYFKYVCKEKKNWYYLLIICLASGRNTFLQRLLFNRLLGLVWWDWLRLSLDICCDRSIIFYMVCSMMWVPQNTLWSGQGNWIQHEKSCLVVHFPLLRTTLNTISYGCFCFYVMQVIWIFGAIVMDSEHPQ